MPPEHRPKRRASGPIRSAAFRFALLLAGVFAIGAAAAQGLGGHAVGARGAAQAKINTAGVERFQGAKLLGDLQRGVVGQHDAARANADAFGAGGQITHDHRGGGAGDARHVVVLGNPEAAVTQRFRVLRQFQRVVQRGGGGGAFGNGTEVQYGERKI